jgi:uncharacterized protein YdeI (BOF family)
LDITHRLIALEARAITLFREGPTMKFSAAIVMILLCFVAITTSVSAKTNIPGSSGNWVSISGRVGEITDKSFVLDHGSGKVLVEMPRLGSDADYVQTNDKVTVHGKIDDNLFKKRSIIALAVYDNRLHRYFYANNADNELLYPDPVDKLGPDNSWIALTGTVKGIQGREFTLDTGVKDLRIDTNADMVYDPTEGPIGLKNGDRVRVHGRIDKADLFEKGEIDANYIVILSRISKASK